MSGLAFTLLRMAWTRPTGFDPFDVDFLAIMIAYLFFALGGVYAGIFAFSQGVLVDIFSSGMHGLFSLLYLAVFVGIYVGSALLNLGESKGQMVIVSGAILLKAILFLAMVYLFTKTLVLHKDYLWNTGFSIALSALLTPVAFSLLNRIRVR